MARPERGVSVINANIGHLPADQNELDSIWPMLLQAIMEEIRSPADPGEAADRMRGVPDFMALIRGWDHMPTAAQANAWEMIQDRLWDAARQTRPFCVRCGECCRRGTPVLYEQDRPLLAAGAIRRQDLAIMRRGEPAYSNRAQKTVIMDREQVKIRDAGDGRTCAYLGPGGDACLIYDDRPHQCRIMECWDPNRFDTVQNLPPLTRLDLLGEDNPLSPIIVEHERRCDLAQLAAAVQSLDNDPAAEQRIVEAVLFDLHVREFAQQKFNLPDEELEFLFGRPMPVIIQRFGVQLESDGQDSIRVVRVPDTAHLHEAVSSRT